MDTHHVLHGLQELGHEVHLVGVRSADTWERGDFETSTLPFPAARLDFGKNEFAPRTVVDRLSRAVSPLQPDLIVVGDSFFLKPLLLTALGSAPVIARYYAHEMACHKDITRFRRGVPCPNNFLDTPDECRRCGAEHLAPLLKQGTTTAWTEEYLAARAYKPTYHDAMRAGHVNTAAAIVYNESMRQCLLPHCKDVVIIPGGVDSVLYADVPPGIEKATHTIFMPGRCEDPVKGLQVLLDAAERLWLHRQDFEVRATLPEDTAGPAWLRPVGWCDQERLKQHYAEADICVVPSIWEEPFGIVALEAMACGRPVCASAIGGLKDIVVDGMTGLHFPAGDSAALAECLNTLLSDPHMRAAMGRAGRERAAVSYDWKHIVCTHYAPLFERVAAREHS